MSECIREESQICYVTVGVELEVIITALCKGGVEWGSKKRQIERALRNG